MAKDYHVLGPEYFSGIDQSFIEEIVRLSSYNKELVYSSNDWSNSLKNYLILTHNPALIKNVELSEIGIMVNRYYWFKKFYLNYSLAQGTDAGIEQQISLLIESIGNKFKDFDWNELQKINESIEGSSESNKI